VPSIAVITATFNALEHIEGLTNSLLQQTDQDFSWVVADGMSTDGTTDYLQSLKMPQLTISVKEDFGIYDALNRAIKLSTADYYVVVGADDQFFPEAVQEFKQAVAEGDPDVAVFDVMYGERRIQPRKRPLWLVGHKAIVAEHAVGTLFKRYMHQQLGYYSKRYPIASDHDFILRCHFNKMKFSYRNVVVGRNGIDGVSGQDRIGSILESFRIQIKHFNYVAQFMLIMLRLVVHAKSSRVKS